MFKFPKLFGRGVSTPVVDESAPFKENIQEIENDIPAGDELSDKIDSLVEEVESQSLPYNAANIFVIDKSGNKISIDEHRENLAKADQIKIKEVRQKIKTNELPDLVSSEVLELDKEIEALDEKIADPEAGVSNQILAKNQIKTSSLQLEREAKEQALDIAINKSSSFTALRKALTDSDYEKKDEALSLIARAETIVKDAYAKGENFQAFSSAFVNLIPNEYGLPLKIRQIGVAISDGLNKKIKGSGRRPAEDSKSRIIFPSAPTKESELEDLKKRIALTSESPEMAEKREQDVIVRANLANLAVKESEATAKKAESEAQEKARKENDERYRSFRWLNPDKVAIHPKGYGPKEVDHSKEIVMFHEASEKNGEANEKEKESTVKVIDTRSSQDLGIDLEDIKKIRSESGEEESGLKIIDKRSIKSTANESLVISEKEIAEALAQSDSSVNKELLETLPASEIAAVEKKNLGFWGKAKSILGNPKVQTQLLTAGVSSAASVLGFKAFYDVPAYFSQRYAVRGNVFGLGKGKGLEGSAEELISASQNRKSEIDEKSEASKGSVMEAIKDLDERLAKTKEGSRKGSEQRQKLAKLLWENRHQAKQTAEERHKELDDILDNYTSTKVSGIQAIRETLNTALVASGAFALRGVTYGGLAYFEKLDEIRRQARVEMAKGDSSLSKEFIKNKVEETVGIKQVFARGLKETFDGVRLKSGKNKTEKTLAAIKSWGSIARFTGIALGIGGGQIYHGASLDKVIDAVEGKLNLAGVGHNFSANAHRLIPSFGTVEAATSLPASPDALPAEIIQPQIQNIVAEKMNLNENNSESINNLDKMLKGNSSETVIPINKIASVLPTEEITAAVGSPEHVQVFLADSENKKTLETLSEKAEAFFNPRITQAERNAAGADINSLKVAFEKEFGARMSFDLDGDVTLRYPDGQSLKIFEGDGRNFVTEHTTASSQVSEIVSGTETGNPPKIETIAPAGELPEKSPVNYETTETETISSGLDPNSPDYVEKINQRFDVKIKSFVSSADGQEKLKILSEQGRKYFDESLPLEERERIIESLNGIRQAIEKDYNCSTNINPEGDVFLISSASGRGMLTLPAASLARPDFNYENSVVEEFPDGLSSKIIEGDGRNFVTEHNSTDNQATEAPIVVGSGNPELVEKNILTVGPRTENLNFSDALNDESVTTEAVPEVISAHESVVISPDLFKGLDADPMATFPQEKLAFADNFPAADRADFEKYFNTNLAERNEIIKQLADWKKDYGDRPQYAEFEDRVRKLLDRKNHELEDVVGVAAGSNKIGLDTTVLGDDDPVKKAEMELGSLSDSSKLTTGSRDAFDELHKNVGRDIKTETASGFGKIIDNTEPFHGNTSFKPLENAIFSNGNEAVPVVEAVGSHTAENIPTMTLAEAKSFDQPLTSTELAKNLTEQGRYINLRNVPSVSSEVLKVWQNENKTINLLGLKPDLLNKDSLDILSKFKTKPILSDEVFKKIEALL